MRISASPLTTKLRQVAAAIVTLIASTSLVWSPALAADNGSWSIFPTATPEVASRPYFQLNLNSKASLNDSVTIANATAKEETFNLYAADAINTADGGFSLKRRTDAKEDVGAWVALPIQQVTLPPRTQIIVPFTLTVPADVEPGDHAGGIVIESTTGTTAEQGDVVVTTLAAVGTRIYIRVQGLLEPELRITNLTVTPARNFGSGFGGPVGADITYTIVNAGNVRLKPQAVTTIEPLFGDSVTLEPLAVQELLPNGSATIRQHINSIWSFGRLTATVNIAGEQATATGKNSAFVIPWYLVALIVLLLLGRWYRQRRIRRRERQQTAEGIDSELPESVSP